MSGLRLHILVQSGKYTRIIVVSVKYYYVDATSSISLV
jgi:hypothetical protein